MADEHTVREARILLERMGARRRRVGADQRAGDGVSADQARDPGAGAANDAWFRQEYMCEFGEIEGRLFSQESIDAAFRDFEPMKL